jgi:hypothetical protein
MANSIKELEINEDSQLLSAKDNAEYYFDTFDFIFIDSDSTTNFMPWYWDDNKSPE